VGPDAPHPGRGHRTRANAGIEETGDRTVQCKALATDFTGNGRFTTDRTAIVAGRDGRVASLLTAPPRALMEQLVFELAAPEPPSFENFLPGRNAEVVAAVARFAAAEVAEAGMLLWGAAGAGKTHLLRAAINSVGRRGLAALYCPTPDVLEGADAGALAAQALIAVDDIDAASPAAQATVFTLYNALKANGGHLLAASRLPAAALPLREDVRTRLGWGLVYEVVPLSDSDKPAALVDYARRRGFTLSDEVIRYLLAHGRRDMTALCTTLAALDRHSLSTKRAITVPLLRDWLQREMPLSVPARPPEGH
jgi:DnaA family protein